MRSSGTHIYPPNGREYSAGRLAHALERRSRPVTIAGRGGRARSAQLGGNGACGAPRMRRADRVDLPFRRRQLSKSRHRRCGLRRQGRGDLPLWGSIRDAGTARKIPVRIWAADQPMQKVVPLSAHSVARARVGLTASDSRLSRFADLTFGAVPIGRLGAIACLSVARLRFGVVSESVRDGRGWLDFARQVEDSGVDVLLLRDHSRRARSGSSWRRSAAWPLRPRRPAGCGWAPWCCRTTSGIRLSWRTRRQACTCCPAGGSSSASGPAGTSPNTTRRDRLRRGGAADRAAG